MTRTTACAIAVTSFMFGYAVCGFRVYSEFFNHNAALMERVGP